MTLSKYIISSFLRVLGLCISGIIILYMIIEFVENLDYFIEHKASIKYAAEYFILKLPMIIFQTTPVTILLSTLLTLGILSRNNEITAMKSCGISMYKVTAPLLILTFLISVFILIGNEAIVPYATQKFYHVKYAVIEKKPPQFFFKQDRVWFKGSDNTIFNIKLLDIKNNQVKGISAYRFDSNFNLIERIDAKEMVYENNSWHLIEGMSRSFLKDGNINLKAFDKKPIALEKKPEEFKEAVKKSEEMSFMELKYYIARLKEEGFNAAKYTVELYAKTSIPFINFIMCLIAIPFAIRHNRSGGIMIGIGVSIIIGIIYFVMLSFGISLGKGGILPPILAAWLANIIFSTAGVVMLLSIRQ